MPRTEEMQKALDNMFPSAAKNISDGKCAFCGNVVHPNTEFRDELSKKEFTISGLCQKCQDEVFGK